MYVGGGERDHDNPIFVSEKPNGDGKASFNVTHFKFSKYKYKIREICLLPTILKWLMKEKTLTIEIKKIVQFFKDRVGKNLLSKNCCVSEFNSDVNSWARMQKLESKLGIFFHFFLFSTFIVFFIKSVSHYKNQQRLSKSIFIILYRTENELDTIQQFIYFISFLFIAYFISSQTVMIIMAPKFEICSSLRRSGICVFCKKINQTVEE